MCLLTTSFCLLTRTSTQTQGQCLCVGGGGGGSECVCPGGGECVSGVSCFPGECDGWASEITEWSVVISPAGPFHKDGLVFTADALLVGSFSSCILRPRLLLKPPEPSTRSSLVCCNITFLRWSKPFYPSFLDLCTNIGWQ